MKTKKLLLVMFAVGLSMINLQAKNIFYVKIDGTGDGTSWAKASNDLQAMINKAVSDDVIFVAKGIYRPNKASNHLAGEVNPYNRNNAFVLKKDVKIYGSFPADANDSEHTSIDSRFLNGWILNTYLLGDIKANGNWADFAYHVVISAGDVGNALLDGFIIANGNANGNTNDAITVNGYTVNNARGGGMINTNSSPTLYGVIIRDNLAKYGGGMYNYSSSPVISESLIIKNLATNEGGGICNFSFSSPTISASNIEGNWTCSISDDYYIQSTSGPGGGISNRSFSSPHIIDSSISENEAEKGGGIYNETSSAPVMENVNITNNKADYGGGMYNYMSGKISFKNGVISKNKATVGGGGGMCNVQCNPVFFNTVIAENKSMTGAGINNSTSSPIFVNVTFSKNEAIYNGMGAYGGAMRNANSSRPEIYNSIIWGNTGSPQVYNESNSNIIYGCSLIESVTNGTNGNIAGTTNPLFIGGSNDNYDYSLNANSPCINKGSNTYYTENGGNLETDKDLNGNLRFFGEKIDIGAYEYGLYTGIQELPLASGITISPSPATDFVTVSSLQGNETLYFYNINGQLLITRKVSSETESVPVGHLPAGIYLLKTSNGQTLKWMKI